MLMIRAMSPQVLAVDEVGGIDDIKALIRAVHAGVKLVATVHGQGICDIQDELKIFERYICLDNSIGTGRIMTIYDENFLTIS